MEKIKKNIQFIVMEIFFIIIGFLVGYKSETYGIKGFIILFLFVAVMLFVQMIVHEAGHLIFGLLTGYKFLSFRIGNLMLVKESEKLKLKRLSIAGTGGQCLMAPPKMKDDKNPYILYNLGGVINNIIFSIILLIIYIALSKTLITEILFFGSLVGFAFAFINGIPMGGIVDNDGMNIINIGKSKEALKAFYIQLKINEELTKGKRLKDMDEKLFKLSSSDNNIISTIEVFNCNRLMDLNKFEEAKNMIEKLLKENKILGLYNNLLICDLIYCNIVLNKDLDKIKSLLTKEQKKFMDSMKYYLSVIRTNYSYELIVEENDKEANKLKDIFNKQLNNHPYEGERVSEMELIEIVDGLIRR